MDVFDVCLKFCNCDFNNKQNIPVQNIKVRKLVLSLLFLQIKLHLETTDIMTCGKSALSFDISHDGVALVVLEIFHKL